MKHVSLLVGLMLMVSGARAITQYRDFTNTKGRVIRGRIVSYDMKAEIVHFERDNRKIAKVPLTIFSEADQIYIREWAILRNFTMDRFFKISAKRKKGEDKASGYEEQYFKRDVDVTGYAISLENRSVSEFLELEAEYCIYYEQEEFSRKKEVKKQGVYCGNIAIDSLAPKSKKVLLTEEVLVYTRELGGGAYYINGQDNKQRGQVHGIWIRIHLKMPSGEKRVREYCLPSSLDNSRAWASSSIDVGMN